MRKQNNHILTTCFIVLVLHAGLNAYKQLIIKRGLSEAGFFNFTWIATRWCTCQQFLHYRCHMQMTVPKAVHYTLKDFCSNCWQGESFQRSPFVITLCTMMESLCPGKEAMWMIKTFLRVIAHDSSVQWFTMPLMRFDTWTVRTWDFHPHDVSCYVISDCSSHWRTHQILTQNLYEALRLQIDVFLILVLLISLCLLVPQTLREGCKPIMRIRPWPFAVPNLWSET